ncbi:hypothetical protein PCC7424_3024 [Gloeothece citriformis PCC 7424]|uniref:Uncharacterized protein n=1 Tax=Gloeothece citriformis (strain PCC 7424) TaxID=65393 RepID=B7KB70_GLOC7|nr:hypothetical protein PCC7424_3024 [Gloeothece citriformis PCC 7424]
MSTTALLIEFFIIGLQTFIWLSMLIVLILGIDWFSIDIYKFLSPVIIIFIAPIIY